MAHTRRTWLAAIAASASLAGCIGDDSDSGSDGDGTDSTDDGSMDGDSTDDGTDDGSADGGSTDGGDADDGSSDGDDTDGSAATVETTDHGQLGSILVDGEGMTLYMFDSDTQGSGASTCSGGCAESWPPLMAEDGAMAGSNVDAELTTFEREDGTTQIAANGWPLYYFTQDSEPGDANGQGVQDVWWVLDPSGAPIRGSGDSSDGSGDDSDDSTGY